MEDTSQGRADIALLHRIAHERTKGKAEGGYNYRTQRANIRRGADAFTETFAYPYVYPALPPDATPKQRTTLLRVAALVAEFTNVPALENETEKKYKPFGVWCAELSSAWAKQKSDTGKASFDPRNPDHIAQRLAYLHTQDFEEAYRTIWRIMQMANTLNAAPSCDYIAIYSLLSRWGNGVSEGSRGVRASVLKDYYGNVGRTKDNTEN